MNSLAPPTHSGKSAIRIGALAARNAMSESDRAGASAAVARHAAPLVREGAVVALYSPIRGELDPGPLARRLAESGHTLSLPVVTQRNAPLTFAQWRGGDVLHAGFGGILQPAATALRVEPDVLFVPLAAYDRKLHRLGYGAGFYDRTLAALGERSGFLAIGLAFAAQEVAILPAEPHDAPMDMIVNEHGVLRRAD